MKSVWKKCYDRNFRFPYRPTDQPTRNGQREVRVPIVMSRRIITPTLPSIGFIEIPNPLSYLSPLDFPIQSLYAYWAYLLTFLNSCFLYLLGAKHTFLNSCLPPYREMTISSLSSKCSSEHMFIQMSPGFPCILSIHPFDCLYVSNVCVCAGYDS